MNHDLAPIAAAAASGPVTDPSPIAWLHAEVGRSLDGAHKLLRQFLRERDSHAGSDVSAHELRGARNARVAIHQCAGALRLADADAPARVLEAADAALGAALERPRKLDAALLEKIEQGSFAVVEFLGRHLADKPVAPLQLFPQLRALLEAGSAERVHPADLWPHAWQWREWPLDASVEPRPADARSLTAFEQLTLANIKTPSPLILARLSELCAALAAGAGERAQAHLRSLWQLAAAVFEALAQDLLASDVFSKRLASRLLALLRTMQRGDAGLDEAAMQRLAEDLLFFCAQSRAPEPAHPAPRLAAVRRAFGLEHEQPVEYLTSTLGRFDPAQLVQARRRVQSAKQAWSSVAAGEPHHLASLGEPFVLVLESLALLFDDGERLGEQLLGAVESVRRSGGEPEPALAIEVATALLYVEAALEDLDAALPEPVHPVTRLAERIAAVRAGAPSQPIEPWIASLYASIADRQMLGTVVQELRASLAAAEQALDRHFRNPADIEALGPVGGNLQSMRGVLSVLGVDSAAEALHAMQFEIDALAAGAPAQVGQLERIAANLGTLGFQIDLYGVQPALARSMFRFDAARAVLESQLGQVGHTAGDAAGAAAPPDLHLTVTAPLEGLPGTSGSSHPLPEPRLTGSAADAEVLEIFTEEARQLLLQAREALAQWSSGVDPSAPLVRLRRIFHTLKGSARMVGETIFGAAAWQAEERIAARLSLGVDVDGGGTGAATAAADDLLAAWTTQAVERFAAAIDGASTGSTAAPAAGDSTVTGATTTPAAIAAATAITTATAVDRIGSDSDSDSDISSDFDSDFALTFDQPVPPLEVDVKVEPAVAAASDASPDTGLDLDLDFDLDFEDRAAVPPEPVLGFPPDLPTAADLDLDIDLEPQAQADLPQPPVAGTATPPLRETSVPSDLDDLLFGDQLPDAPPPASGDDGTDLAFLQLDLGEGADADLEPIAGSGAGAGGEIDVGIATHIDVDISDEVTAPAHRTPAAFEPEPEVIEPRAEAWSPTPDDSAFSEPEHEASAPTDLEPLTSDAPSEAAEPAAAPAPPSASSDDIDLAIGSGLTVFGQPFDMADETVTDAFKQVGELRIPIELFNIFLNEAEDLSLQLLSGLSTWSAERWQPLPDSLVARAHALAGSSATVGFDALSELAHELEAGLLREQQLGRRGIGGSESDAQLFCSVAEEMRGLLHQFAAGFLREPNAELRERLLRQRPSVLQRLQASDAAETPMPADFVDTDWQSVGQDEWLPPAPTLPQPLDGAAPAMGTAESIDADLAGTPGGAFQSAPATDVVDPVLFPVFEEEAQDLLPQLATALRIWARYGDPSGAAAAMRHLHTFKGGARLAGALGLGELAHRLESHIEAVTGNPMGAAAGSIDALLAEADALQHAFEALREADRSAYSEADAQALARANEAPADVPVQPTAPAAVREQDEPVAQPHVEPEIDWSRFASTGAGPDPQQAPLGVASAAAAQAQGSVRVRAALLDRMVDQAGEVNMSRARIEVEMIQLRGAISGLGDDVERLRQQLHDMELQAELQLTSGAESATAQRFDPLEIDRFTRLHELTRMMAESVADVAAVQRSLKRNLQRTEDELAAQTRLTRDLQADLLRTRLVEFDTIAERLHRVARQAAGEAGKLMQLEITGGSIELDRGVLHRLTPAFEHLIRNAATHGIEPPGQRVAMGKPEVGQVVLQLSQHGNQISIELRDDGAGLDLVRIRERAWELGLGWPDGQESDLIFTPGFSTATALSELAGRGVGLDVVRNEVLAVNGQIEVTSVPGLGCRFTMELPLTTAMTQVLMLRCGDLSVAVPATLVEHVRRIDENWFAAARADGYYLFGDLHLPMYWLGALLQHSAGSSEAFGRSRPLVIVHAGRQRVALLVDEVLGQQEAIVKPVGPQLARVPGLAGMSVLASGAVALIYNPLALAAAHGDAALRWSAQPPVRLEAPQPPPSSLVLVVDDSLTVRRVTQRLLQREGYRVVLAKDGVEALERIGDETPRLILSDIEMPRMDGYQLVEALRADLSRAAIPVVMITSRSADKHRTHAESLGVVAYLGKPYGEGELLSIVARYCAPAPERTTA